MRDRRRRFSGPAGLLAGMLGFLLLATAGQAATPAGPAVGATATYRWSSSLTESVPVVVQQPGPGGQVTWSITQEAAPVPPIVVTYAIVRGDRKTYTLQIVTRTDPDGTPLSITQVTVDRASGKAVRSVIARPKGLIATIESGLRPFREADVAQGRPEEVTVPAGRFTTVHGTAQEAEVWVSEQVPALGLVKGVWPEGTLELLSSAPAGAQDLLKGVGK